ncbi:hypothetical protein IFM89_038547 [Coptis chinensis]|uniref:Pentatricopeptide repeat-containing protein n=1 Tax=Coptis chinensis TaxID=261450 RepID=A0A835IJM1_9MAGN|nr:hypothetical protein IFM89_038547 [Coptis chinensis]
MDERDLVSWSSIIACLVDHDFNDEALGLFREMQLFTSVRPDKVTMVSVITAVSNLGYVELDRWAHFFIYINGLDVTVALDKDWEFFPVYLTGNWEYAKSHPIAPLRYPKFCFDGWDAEFATKAYKDEVELAPIRRVRDMMLFMGFT